MRVRIFPIIPLLAFLTLAGCSDRNHSNAEDQLNHLANATSPYLRQHADNPVDWYEWGSEALNKAKEENKPLIISIGYAACHWCHVMERESFMDTAVARMMNENFIAIKIDREERPDIDQIYLNAAQLISGRGGWPLNAFALPDGKPFFAATYFPKEQWINLLKQVADAYRNENENVIKQAQALTDGIQSFEAIPPPNDESHTFDQKSYQNIFLQWQSFLDYENGGLAGAPKFPMPVSWEFLLQYNHLTGDKKALEAVLVTLDEMSMGGIYDQLGGGFSRYSTDQNWRVPHFEKMLYDNGQLASLYAHAYQQTQKPEYAEVIRETLEFIRLELTDSSGGFYSSINADSEHEEGKFYVWSKKEVNDKLDPETAELFSQYFGITDSGNWESGKNILHKKFTKEEFARQNGISEEEWHNKLSNAKKILLQERSKRIRPSTDDKILTSWNAIMLNGYIDAYFALGNKEYLQTALKNAHFLDKNMVRKDGSVWRNYKDGTATIAAFLDDYALLAKSFIRLYQATLDIYWLEKSKYIADYTIKHFHNEENGMFYYTSDQSENLIARKMELTDNVIPSSNSVFADVLYRLGEYYGQDSYIQMSKTMLNQVVKNIASGPYYANWAYLFGMVSYQPYEVAIMGEQALEKSTQLQQQYLPLAIFMGGEKENLPLLENKHVAGKTIIYVCRNKVCKLPVQTIEEAMQQLK